MPASKLLFVAVLLASNVLRAQTPAPPQDQAPAPVQPAPLPVPGGGQGLGQGLGQADRPAPTKEEALEKAKEQAEQIADLQARRIAQQLNLSPAQLNRVRAILVEREEVLRKAFSPDAPGAAEHPLTPQDRQLKIQQMQQETMKKIELILNPAQKQQFAAMQARSRAEQARRAAIAAARRHSVPATMPAPGAAPASPAPADAPASSNPPPPSPAPSTPPQSN